MHTCLGLELGRAWEMKQALISSSVFQYLLQNPSACENWATKDETTIRGRSAHLGPMASPAGCSGTFKMFPARLCWENHLMIIIWKHEIHWDTFYTSIYIRINTYHRDFLELFTSVLQFGCGCCFGEGLLLLLPVWRRLKHQWIVLQYVTASAPVLACCRKT